MPDPTAPEPETLGDGTQIVPAGQEFPPRAQQQRRMVVRDKHGQVKVATASPHSLRIHGDVGISRIGVGDVEPDVTKIVATLDGLSSGNRIDETNGLTEPTD